MLSLENALDEDGVRTWFDRVFDGLSRRSGEVAFCIEPKIDGLGIALVYQGGRLVQAATRGKGDVGEDVTRTAASIADIPGRLAGYDGDLEVRGEVFMESRALAELNCALE